MYTDDQQRNYLSLWHSGYGKIKTYINYGKKNNNNINWYFWLLLGIKVSKSSRFTQHNVSESLLTQVPKLQQAVQALIVFGVQLIATQIFKSLWMVLSSHMLLLNIVGRGLGALNHLPLQTLITVLLPSFFASVAA